MINISNFSNESRDIALVWCKILSDSKIYFRGYGIIFFGGQFSNLTQIFIRKNTYSDEIRKLNDVFPFI